MDVVTYDDSSYAPIPYLCNMASVQEVDLHLRAFMRNTSGLSGDDMVKLSHQWHKGRPPTKNKSH